MAKKRDLFDIAQGRFEPTFQREEEVMLELTVPLTADIEEFRVGWSLKGMRRSGWLAISTGRAVWKRAELDQAAGHVLWLLEAADDFVSDRIQRHPEA